MVFREAVQQAVQALQPCSTARSFPSQLLQLILHRLLVAAIYPSIKTTETQIPAGVSLLLGGHVLWTMLLSTRWDIS